MLERITASSKEELTNKLIERESYYIAKYDSYHNGLNGNLGGTGNKGVVFDDARRKQNGDNRQGKPHKSETIELLMKISAGRKKSAEEIAKISKGNTGKKRSREAQSRRMRGSEPKAATAGAKAWREKNGGGFWRGKILSSETIAKRNVTRRKTSQRIKVTASDGSVTYHQCQRDAAKATNLKDGSLKYALDHNNGLHAKSGFRFEKISDTDFNQANKNFNSFMWNNCVESMYQLDYMS